MTTIAVKSGLVAFDSRVTDLGTGEITPDSLDKCWISEKHPVVYACCGEVTRWYKTTRYLDSLRRLPWEHPIRHNHDFPNLGDISTVLVIERDGTVYCFEARGWYKIKGGVVTIGSGGRAAHGAMIAGAPADEAVYIAIELDSASGPPVNVIRLADLPAARKHVNGSRPSATAAGRRAEPAPQQIRRTEEYGYARAARAGRARTRDQRRSK